MKDNYSLGESIPAGFLVPPDAQPDYPDATQAGLTLAPGPVNVGYQLADAQVAAGRGDSIAAIHADSGETYTFGRLASQSSRLAAGLVRYGIRPGDRIAYYTPNDPCALIVMLGIWKAGAVLVPIPANTRKKEIEFYIEDTQARLAFVHARAEVVQELVDIAGASQLEKIFTFGENPGKPLAPSWEALLDADEKFCADVSADQPAIVWHTGGTTGKPKGCYHTHKRFLLAGLSMGRGADVRPGQRWCAAAPIGHALGIIHSTTYVLLHGGTVVLLEKYSDAGRLLDTIDRHGVTVLTALMVTWGKMAEMLKEGRPWDGSSLKRCFAMWQTASSANVFDFWLARGVELLNNFGSTSFATWVLIPPPGSEAPRSALGKAQPGYRVEAVELEDNEVRILPQGEIGRMAVRGVSGLTYWNLPAMQARDVVNGWTICDDLIRFDENGFAHYLGRSDYMISTAGFKVAPAEVELALSRHPAVLEVAVVPAPCPIRLEMVAAFVVLNIAEYDADQLRTELTDLVRNELSAYKAPRRIEFVAALPRDGVGKVQTRIIKQWAYSTMEESARLRKEIQ
jgi:2-aminobenzoate-CoA ligase